MSLAIEVDSVASILLSDGWHDVAFKSFDLDAYEYLHDKLVLHGGGQSDVCATGFIFTCKDGSIMCGPLTSIQAVKIKVRKRVKPR